MGMALDINRLYRGRGWLSVQSQYEATPDQRTCSGPQPSSGAARVLRRIACDLYRSGKFQSVLTPNYNEGHRDHFHIDFPPRRPPRLLALTGVQSRRVRIASPTPEHITFGGLVADLASNLT
ncbi:MAG: extensin family protein [Sandaracinaceae bacterium]|nr:extensin family protein [Sandaracinaceae bacterium]